ncbi:MAG TPA: hypothetical protein PLS49_07640, partial [Candidatus Woesebacteria bacterium]|nr:hypothetical protein [Candidatus Woesebacteria bacterium]
HAFEDWSTINLANSVGYAAFDAKPTIIGISDYQHLVGFQSRVIYTGSGDVTNYLDSLNSAPVHNGTGTIASVRGLRIHDIAGTGPVAKNYGIYVEGINRGSESNYGLYISPVSGGSTNNYSIYSNGGKSVFADPVSIGRIASPLALLNVALITPGVEEIIRLGYANSVGSGGKIAFWAGNSAIETGRIEHILDSVGQTSTRFYSFYASSLKETMRISNGNVGIGTTNPAYKLDVNGDINTTGDIRKNGAAYNNPDYVFEPDYDLMSLSDLKSFVSINKHLPGVPSSEDVKRDGVKLFEQTRLNLEKTEEAYLYLFD